MAGSGKVTENAGSFIACAALEFPAASKSIVAQSFPRRMYSIIRFFRSLPWVSPALRILEELLAWKVDDAQSVLAGVD